MRPCFGWSLADIRQIVTPLGCTLNVANLVALVDAGGHWRTMGALKHQACAPTSSLSRLGLFWTLQGFAPSWLGALGPRASCVVCCAIGRRDAAARIWLRARRWRGSAFEKAAQPRKAHLVCKVENGNIQLAGQ